MTRRPAPWKIVTFGAALTGLGVAGIGIAAADDDRERALPATVAVAADDDRAPAPSQVDASPGTADSPDESATDTPDAAPAPADASPDDLSADSPDAGSSD